MKRNINFKTKLDRYRRFFTEANFWGNLGRFARRIGLKSVYTALLMYYAYRRKETPFWAKWGVALLGSQQSARFLHHLVMWWFLIFAVIHIYFCVWNDCKNPEGLISSIFSGAKFKHKA